jgi:ankyrin repeat protein
MNAIEELIKSCDIESIKKTLNILHYYELDHLLRLCCIHNKLEIAKIILSYQYAYLNNIKWNYLLKLAIVCDNIDFVKFAIENRAMIHEINHQAFKIACCQGNIEIVKYLISIGAKVDAGQNYSIKIAASNGHNDIVLILIDNGADVTADNNAALNWARNNGHHETVNLLIEHGAINNHELTPKSEYTIEYYTDQTNIYCRSTFGDLSSGKTRIHRLEA